MNLDELVKQAKSLLSEAQEALDNDDLELAATKRQEAADLGDKIEAAKEQAKLTKAIEGYDEPEPQETGKAVRLPFSDTDEPNPVDNKPEPEDTMAKSVHIMRYGDVGAAQKAILNDLYGADYYAKKDAQRTAFVKYMRFGESKLSSNDIKLMQQVIALPEQLTADIKAGTTVAELKATLQEGILDLGGYTVPEDFRVQLISRLAGLTIMRSGGAMQVNTIRDAVEWPKIEGGNSRYTSGVRVTWVDEVPSSATVAQTNPTFGMLRIPVHTVMARTDLSRNLLEDSAFNLVDVVSRLFAEAMAIDEDQQFLIGTGGGTPRGILGNRSGAEATPETGITAVASGDASTLTADGLLDLVYGLQAQYRQNAVAMAATATFKTIRKLKDGNGDYLWERGLQKGEPPMLLGYPLLESEALPAVGVNTHPIIFGDPAGYMIVDRVGMTVERVSDTTTVGTNTVALFARRRLGGQVIEPWRFQAQQVST